MPDETDTLIETHLKALPPYVVEAFRALRPFEKIRIIATDFKLHVDEAERLQNEVLLVMLGLASPDEFIEETSKSFGLSDEDSTTLVDRISADLFMPIRGAMQKYVEELSIKDVPATISTEPSVAPTIYHAPLPVPSQKVPLTPPALPTTPSQSVTKPTLSSNPADAMLTKPQSSTAEKITVGISPAKNTYTVDPYLEPPV